MKSTQETPAKSEGIFKLNSLSYMMKVRDRPLSSTPQCDNRTHGQRCPAHLYLYRLSDLRYLSLDITQDEADLIHRGRMDFDDVIAHFELDMPPVA